jgi:FHA domain
MSATCPQGHRSDDTEYCDTCGTRIGAPSIAVQTDEPTSAPVAPSMAPEPAEPSMPCPKCGTMRLGDDQFCEDCGFDFLDPDAEVDTVADDPTVPIDDERPTWRAVVAADRDHYDRNAPDDIAFPAGVEPRVVMLDRDCVRIGRRSEGRDTHPEIDLAGPPLDTGVSRMHAVLNRQGDGSYTLVDVGSANGTTVNRDSTPLPDGESRPLRHGDQIHVGAWTTITILRDPEPD